MKRVIILGVFLGMLMGWLIGVAIERLLVITANASVQDEKREMKLYGFVYVYDREAEMWNRATKEDLMNAKCEDIRVYYPFK
jgi:hypothetical protein